MYLGKGGVDLRMPQMKAKIQVRSPSPSGTTARAFRESKSTKIHPAVATKVDL
jgi:hypothetical protein